MPNFLIWKASPTKSTGWVWLALFAALALASPSTALARSSTASAIGVSSAQIVQPISISAIEKMDFGYVAVSETQGGSVTLEPANGAVSYTGSASAACTTPGGCAPHAARFLVAGESGRDFIVSVPDSVTAHGETANAPDLQIHDIRTSSRNRPGADAAGRLDANGQDELRVGGTLHVPAGNPPGKYEAEVQIVVSYS